jgi:hypothetical protein
MKTLMMLVGAIAIAMGLLWAAQGTGIFPYPSSSFMINDVNWFYYGIVTAACGVVVIVMARRRGRAMKAQKPRDGQQ